MSPAEAVSWFQSLSPSVVRLGLDRVQAALAALHNPQLAYPAIHVAGTNGKGSTCAFAASCLVAQGYRVGLYTSPHLVQVHERFQIGGRPISSAVLGQRVLEVLAATGPNHELTFFEFGTVLALWHFSQEQVDVAVLEAGLGGRLDAVTCARPAVTAITAISFDHQDYLGHTLQAIAAEKAGILKPEVPVVLSRQRPEVLEVLEQAARRVGSPVLLEGREFCLEPDPDGPGLTYRGLRTRVPGLRPGLRGPHQVQNAAVALAALELLEDHGLRISPDQLRAGLASTQWPGRLEEIAGGRVVLDGAHNPAGAEALAQALDAVYPGRKVHLVFGVLADKDHRPMLRALLPRCAAGYLAPVGSPRSLDPQRYLEAARGLNPNVQAFASGLEALAAARRAAGPDDLVLCAGSLFLVGQLRAALV